MDSITIFKKDCTRYAKQLGDYQNISIDDLANGYCKAMDEDDEINKNSYLCALILRFWYTIKKMYDKTITANYGSYEDYTAKLFECINIACAPENRAWQDPSKKTSAQACINQTIASRGVAEIMYESNLDKHKVRVGMVSLDATVNNNPDYTTLCDSIEDEAESPERVYAKLNAEFFIQSYIDKDKILEAIILDTIAFNSCEKETKKVIKVLDTEGNEKKITTTECSFWEYRAVQVLSSLPESYANYFINKYNVGGEALKATLAAMRKWNNQKLYKQLRKTLNYVRETAALRN